MSSNCNLFISLDVLLDFFAKLVIARSAHWTFLVSSYIIVILKQLFYEFSENFLASSNLVMMHYIVDVEVDVDGLAFSEILRPPSFVSRLFGISTPFRFISSWYFSNSAPPIYFLPLSSLFRVEGGMSNIPPSTVLL